MSRVDRITRCTDELAQCRAQLVHASDPLLPLLGIMDWLEELHNLIHEEIL